MIGLVLRHLKIFHQPTKYATVIGYLKALQDRWEGFQKVRVDNTREGPSIISVIWRRLGSATLRELSSVLPERVRWLAC